MTASNPGRRRFLRSSATTAGAAAALTMLPPSIQRALAIPPNNVKGTIEDVEHVVILTQENRSFDHYFGTLQGVRGFNDPRPHVLPDGRPVWYQPTPNESPVDPKRVYNPRGLPSDATYVLPFYIDPRTTKGHAGTQHGWSDGHGALNNGKNNQWLNQKQDAMTMGYLRRRDLAFHYALADAFTICDAYHASVPADTVPNRVHLWTGTIDPRNVMGTQPNGPGLQERNGSNGYTWTTYPERLEAKGIRWKLYQGGSEGYNNLTKEADNFTDNSLEHFAAYQTNGVLRDKGASRHTLVEFASDVSKNNLPQVSWIVAPQKFCEHSSATSVNGALYIEAILSALTSNPEVWSKTVFLINYDENDGLFDHIVPPMPPLQALASNTNDSGLVSKGLVDSLKDEFLDLDRFPYEKGSLVPSGDPGGLQPVGLGSRVPMLVVSPWSAGGWVCSQTFDHTSVLQFLEARFGVAEPNISQWRKAVCGNLTSAFDFSGNQDTSVPKIAPVASITVGTRTDYVPNPQLMPSQEPGTRKARPLPYEHFVHSRVDTRNVQIWLDFANTGSVGAAFCVYNRLKPNDNPRRYTVSPGDVLSDYWLLSDTKGAYDFAAYGPNGYLCQYKGNASAVSQGTASPEAKVCYDVTNGNVALTLTNSGSAACSVTVSNAYSKKAARTHNLAAGATLQDLWVLSASSGWYDLSVSSDAGSSANAPFLRRFAGHVETGKASMSDPGPLNSNR
ncbi:phosphocholine-specific phospholipase C [Variovorax sp. GB1P17]|uniref:phosphocholine-specific phospholipase C n=1 Tax=Variovorax sp. GB1P17 TaxID=3443740 RepID=UPI003F469F11